MSNAVPTKPKRVLSTLNEDGSRNWLRPRVSKGRFLTARRIVAYLLILVFTVLPFLKMNGKPLILIDIVHRQFTFFGKTFLPTDTLLLAFFMVGLFVTIFLITALFGRVWCGWCCPQTVYMEFLFRPIERLFEGAPGRKQTISGATGFRKALKYAVYLLLSVYLANTFLAYFVGVDQLRTWVTQSPVNHPTGFIVVLIVTGLMMFDFSFFREQVCIVACPYGRFQSVMLDRNSLIVSYDRNRGEPRGRMRKRARTQAGGDVHLNVVEDEPRGDCIDCHMCVTTCPTGIDIRDGLQMECIGCAQCIDACDSVMRKIGRPLGLIRYSSQEAMEQGTRHLVRPRVLIYPMLLVAVGCLFAYVLLTKPPADVKILPREGAPFYALPSGDISNQLRVRIINRRESPATYIVEPVEGSVVTLAEAMEPVTLQPLEPHELRVQLVIPPDAFRRGKKDVYVRVRDERGFAKELMYRMLGPGSMKSVGARAPETGPEPGSAG